MDKLLTKTLGNFINPMDHKVSLKDNRIKYNQSV